jgi:hypothetical protein
MFLSHARGRAFTIPSAQTPIDRQQSSDRHTPIQTRYLPQIRTARPTALRLRGQNIGDEKVGVELAEAVGHTSSSWLTNICSIHFIRLCHRDSFLVLIGIIYSANLFN